MQMQLFINATFKGYIDKGATKAPAYMPLVKVRKTEVVGEDLPISGSSRT
jgi:hypothetical protein